MMYKIGNHMNWLIKLIKKQNTPFILHGSLKLG